MTPVNPTIAFTDGEGTWSTWVMNADGSNRVRILNGIGASFSWSPLGDGSLANPWSIALAHGLTSCALSRVDVVISSKGIPVGVNRQQLALPVTGCSGLDPAWSPLGGEIAFTATGADGASRLWLIPAAGGPATPLYSAPEGGRIRDPAWRSDALRIAFIEYDVSASSRRWIRVLDLTTSTVTTVFDPAAGGLPGFVRGLDWARTGDVLAFDWDCPVGVCTGHQVFTLSLAPQSSPVPVARGDFPAWSPDDTRLVYSFTECANPTCSKGKHALQVIDRGTGAKTTITSLSGPFSGYPDWRR